MNTNITKGKWVTDGKYIVATTSPESYPRFYNDGTLICLMLSDEDEETNVANKGEQYANAQAIASLPDIIRENEELKARCETYKKDYDSMVAEIVRLSGENSKMKEMICERIKELEKE